MSDILYIAFAIDEDYLQHFTVALVSILENNRESKISVFVMHDIKELKKAFEIIEFFKCSYNVEVNLLQIESQIFNSYPNTAQYPKSIYFRLLIADIIPKNINRLLYLDSDVIITGSLSELLTLDFEDKLLFASEELLTINIPRLNGLGIPIKRYFNSGVLLINLCVWRLENISSGLMQTAEKYKEDIIFPDQDILNIFLDNQWKELPQTYNTTDINKVKELIKPPVLIHFMGGSKPWHYLNLHPFNGMYWKYLKLSPYKDYIAKGYQYEKIFRKQIYWIKHNIYIVKVYLEKKFRIL